jgi:ribose transport system permease protein
LSQTVTGAPPAAQGRPARSRLSWDVALRLGLLGIVIALAVVFTLTAPGFLSPQNLENNERQMAVIGILAIGETFVIITAGIDLSVGSMLGFSGILMALALSHGIAIPLALGAVLVIATLLGLFNGLLIDTAALPPFIVTLGMLGILRGFTQIFGNGQQIGFGNSAFTDFAADNFLGIPQLFWMLVVIALLAAYLLHLTRRGRHVFAIGSNLEGARRAGINVRGVTLFVYAISGLLAGIAGLLLTARQAQGDPNAGTGYELDAIAAAVLGGASLFGARGSILGTFLGVLLVQILTNGLNLLNFDPQVARIVEGALLIAFVYMDHWRKRRLATA